jgi:hypothetical protein
LTCGFTLPRLCQSAKSPHAIFRLGALDAAVFDACDLPEARAKRQNPFNPFRNPFKHVDRTPEGAEECLADHALAGAARWLRVRVKSATWTTLIVSGLAVVAAGGLAARTQTGTRPVQSLATSH